MQHRPYQAQLRARAPRYNLELRSRYDLVHHRRQRRRHMRMPPRSGTGFPRIHSLLRRRLLVVP